jgi:hypothetical protein
MKIARFNQGRIGVVVDADSTSSTSPPWWARTTTAWPPVGPTVLMIGQLRPRCKATIEAALPTLPRLPLASVTLLHARALAEQGHRLPRQLPRPWPRDAGRLPR